MQAAFLNFKNDSDENILKDLGNNLKKGSIGIFPTDTVYGIGCNAFDEIAIKKLFELKSRNYSKPISVLISDSNMLYNLVEDISKEEQKLIDTFWPGALTIIFKKKHNISNLLTSNLDTIGIRMPNDKIALDLLNFSNIPLATTSANISGEDAGINVSDFYNCFNNKVDFIIDTGISDICKSSTVVQIIKGIPHILREGSITKEQIEEVLKKS